MHIYVEENYMFYNTLGGGNEPLSISHIHFSSLHSFINVLMVSSFRVYLFTCTHAHSICVFFHGKFVGCLAADMSLGLVLKWCKLKKIL